MEYANELVIPHLTDTTMLDQNALGIPEMDAYLFGAFMPGTIDLGFNQSGFESNIDQQGGVLYDFPFGGLGNQY